ncbi:DUF998 domain-containing protein [Nonomuraea sp. LP-02]|uniref:DUF998 domain-containing protein n=1 Tax=Nonomuraea sp. LP-02 TaxID=3097960 RepID=UPI002E34128F|nr:DUF998 domain-containing protein [Nonomuraea sp. LP-02]MED7926725.1 DUF998 domain-containing protein [Nonomuraea sp. LP-02]
MIPRWSLWATAGGTAVSAAALTWTELTLPAQPLISDYALVAGGLVPVLVGMLALAGACLSLAYGLVVADPARTAATRVLLLAGAAGLMLSAVFPTDPGSSQVGTLAGEIHRWAAAVVFTSLPVAGWTFARGRAGAARWNAVRAMSVTAALTLAAYLAAHPATVTSPLINGVAYYGPLERAVVLAEMVLLVTMAVAAASRRVSSNAAATPTATAPTTTGPTATGPAESAPAHPAPAGSAPAGTASAEDAPELAA